MEGDAKKRNRRCAVDSPGGAVRLWRFPCVMSELMCNCSRKCPHSADHGRMCVAVVASAGNTRVADSKVWLRGCGRAVCYAVTSRGEGAIYLARVKSICQ